MPQSVDYGEAEILRVGIRPGELPTERLAPLPNLGRVCGQVWDRFVKVFGCRPDDERAT
jgi:hypothetical protein